MIAVTGAAGGVGCTSLAVNLATTLLKITHRDTVLADFDLLLGSLEESLAVIPDNSLEVVVRNIDDIDPTLLKRWLPRHPCGLYILPHPVNMEEAARLDPESLRQVLALLRDTFTTVVIDTSKGLQVTDFLAFETADVILVVVQLNLNPHARNTVAACSSTSASSTASARSSSGWSSTGSIRRSRRSVSRRPRSCSRRR